MTATLPLGLFVTFPILGVRFRTDGLHTPGMDFGVGGFDESVETRALTTGTNFIKDLFAAKVKQIKITVRPYHKILIKNN